MKNYFDNIKRYRAFSVKYRPATDFKSSRITIYDERLGERVTIPYNHSFDNPWQIAVTYLLNLPHPIEIESLGMSKDDSHVLLTTNFSTSMKQAELNHRDEDEELYNAMEEKADAQRKYGE